MKKQRVNTEVEQEQELDTLFGSKQGQTNETFEKTMPAAVTSEAAKSKFETETPLKQISIPFHDFVANKTLTGIFLGMGPTVRTKKSDGDFYTYAFLDVESEMVTLVTASKTLEKINDDCEPGHYLVKITANGKKESAGGREYNSFDVSKAKLKEPFTDFDIEDIRQSFKKKD